MYESSNSTYTVRLKYAIQILVTYFSKHNISNNMMVKKQTYNNILTSTIISLYNVFKSRQI